MPKTKKSAKKSSKNTNKRTYKSESLTFLGRTFSKLQLASIAAVLVFASIGAYLTFFSHAASISTYPHPQATLNAGKGIYAIQGWNGKVYAGYGNWESINSGPITINAFDGTNYASSAPWQDLPNCAQGVTSPEACNFYTHDLERWRVLKVNGVEKLYAPSAQPAEADYAVGTRNADGSVTWKTPSVVAGSHIFDMNTLTGSDLWLIGSKGDSAIAWRSLDGGTTWHESLNMPGAASKSLRFYSSAVYNGKLYTELGDINGNSVSRGTKVFDPATSAWSDGPDLAAATRYCSDFAFGKADSFAGKLLLRNRYFQGCGLEVWNGSTTSEVMNGVSDYAIEGSYIYVHNAGQIKRSNDLSNWEVVSEVPAGYSSGSIAVLNGTVYLGDHGGNILKLDPAGYTPPPTSGGGSVSTDTVAPTVGISSPASGSTLGSRTTIQASATDNVKVTKMEIYDGSNLLKTSTSGSIKYGWNTRNVISGAHTITVKAYDAVGNAGQASITVNK